MGELGVSSVDPGSPGHSVTSPTHLGWITPGHLGLGVVRVPAVRVPIVRIHPLQVPDAPLRGKLFENRVCDVYDIQIYKNLKPLSEKRHRGFEVMSPPADEHERLLIEGKKRLERSVSIPMLACAAPFCLH